MRGMVRFSILVVILAVSAVFAANTLSAGGVDGIVRCLSADPLGRGGFQLGGALHYGQEWDYIKSVTPDAYRYGSPRMLSGAGYIGVGLSSILDVGMDLPAYYDNPQFGSIKPKSVGDLEVSVKFNGFTFQAEEENAVTGAYYVAVQIPTGDKTKGFFPRHVYYASDNHFSSGNVLVLPMLIATIHFDRLKSPAPLQLHLNFGGVFNAPTDHNALTASVGLEYLLNEIVTLFTEVSTEERIGSVHSKTFKSDLDNNPIFITPGLKFKIPKSNVALTFAGDIGISEKYSGHCISSVSQTNVKILHQANMLYNAIFAINWMIPGAPKDTDHDGIPDKQDKCPDMAGIAENEGCPDVDSDNDGLVDRLDKCPNDAEDKDGFQDDDGCPDNDNDGDGVPDKQDKCPDKAGIAENEGCPDVDSDNDGLVDRLDKCPNDAEDKDDFQDDDGCPDNDNDGDGIPDLTDKYPNNPGAPENNGCPKTKEITRGQLILKGVNFESGKDVLLAGSYKVLDEIALSLREWPEVKIEIQGHCDNTGRAVKNMALSQRRAETVMRYLIGKGIAADRLTAVGYGQDRPIADNKTAAGRAQNRRVELNRTD